MNWTGWKQVKVGSHWLLLASEPWQKIRGLQGIKELPYKTLMLFTEIKPSSFFHTKGCLVPVDILALDVFGRVIEIWKRVPPGQEWIGPTPINTFFVLEAIGGWAENFGLERGSSIRDKL